MAKSNRKSQPVGAGITPLQYEESMAKYASNYAEQNKLTAEMDKRITEIRAEYDGPLLDITKEQGLLEAVIKGYCVQNKASLFVNKRTLETIWGKVGFRLGTPTLSVIKGFKVADVIANLKAKLPGYIRTVERMDKNMLIADRNKEGVCGLYPELGVRVSQGERFFIEVKTEEVVVAAAPVNS